MAIPCGKRSLTFLWGILECLFFSGIINGWLTMEYILKKDHFFLDSCNVSFVLADSFLPAEEFPGDRSFKKPGYKCVTVLVKLPNTPKPLHSTKATPSLTPFIAGIPFPGDPHVEPLVEGGLEGLSCEEQEGQLETAFTLVFILRNVLMLPFGIFLDKYGTSRTRLLAILCLAFGSLMMLFSGAAFPWLILPALTLLGISGNLILMTDLQIANLFAGRRYTAMATIVGAYLSGGLTVTLMQVTDNEGINLQTSFMFITAGVVPVLISTIVLLPKSRVPWPLPADYAGSKCRRDAPPITPVLRSSLYATAVLWFCILQLKSSLFEMNLKNSLATIEGNTEENVSRQVNLYSMITLLCLPVAPFIGFLMDFQITVASNPGKAQMLNITRALVLVLVLSVCSGVLVLVSNDTIHIITFVLQSIEKVAVLAAFFAFFTHLYFPAEHFGKCVGLAFAVSGLFLLLQFPMAALVVHELQRDPFYINLFMLFIVLLTIIHPLNVWYQCKKGQLSSEEPHEKQKNSVTIMLMDSKQQREGEEEGAESDRSSTQVTLKSGLQITDL